MIRRVVFLFLTIALVLPLTLIGVSAEPSEDGIAYYEAKNPAAAYCVDTDQLLYSVRGEEVYAPGVGTKLMALMVAYDLLADCNRPLSTEIDIRASWVTGTYVAGDRSSPYLGISNGERYTLEYLFAATLVANANDACAALVGYCADSILNDSADAFVKKMNERAAELGLKDTHFENAVGFGGTGTTTANDLAKLAAAFYQYDKLVKMSDCYAFGSIKNKNYLKCDYFVKDYLLGPQAKDESGAIGLIAGQATNAGNYCVITACEKAGVAYVYVVLGAISERIEEDGTRHFLDGNAYQDILQMVPYIQSAFSITEICKPEDFLAELRLGGGAQQDFVRLVPSRKIELMLSNPKNLPIETRITYVESVYDGTLNGKAVKMANAPIRQGDVMGTATFLLDGKEIATVDLLAESSVETNTLKTTFSTLHDFLFSGPMATIIRVILVIIGAWILILIVSYVIKLVKLIRRKKNAKGEQKDAKDDQKGGKTQL